MSTSINEVPLPEAQTKDNPAVRDARLEAEMHDARRRYEDAKDERYVYCAVMLRRLVTKNIAPPSSVCERLDELDAKVLEAGQALREARGRLKEFRKTCPAQW